MSYSKIENALKTVLPDAVYKVQAPETTNDGEQLLRYLVWTPTGDRYAYANSRPFATIYQAVVTVATQTEDDTLPRRSRQGFGGCAYRNADAGALL